MGRIYDQVIKLFGISDNDPEYLAESCEELETLSESAMLNKILSWAKLQNYYKWLVLELLEKGASVYYKPAKEQSVVGLIKGIPGCYLDNLVLYRSSLIAIQSARVHPRLQGVKYSRAMNKVPKELWIKVAEMIEFSAYWQKFRHQPQPEEEEDGANL